LEPRTHHERRKDTMKKFALLLPIAALCAMQGCATNPVPAPEIRLDEPAEAVPAPEPPAPVEVVAIPQPLPLPDQLKPVAEDIEYWPKPEAASVPDRVEQANKEARITP